jgi:hypothetical protein
MQIQTYIKQNFNKKRRELIMKITKKQLVEIISEEIKQVLDEVGRGIPVGGGEALTCAEAGAKAGAAYAIAKPDIAKSIINIAVQAPGAKNQILGKHSAHLDKVALAAMEAQNRLSCQEGPGARDAMDAFRDAFLNAANKKFPLGWSDVTPPEQPAQIKTDRRTRGYDHIGESLTKEQLKQIIKEEIQNVQEEKSYPNNSTMRKLVKQAKMDGRYKEEDVEKLKKDYDKHVRGTLRDPKHSQAHKKKVNETQLDVVPIDAPVEDIIAAMKEEPSYLKGTIIYQLNMSKKMGYEEKAQAVIDALGWTEEAANHWSAK